MGADRMPLADHRAGRAILHRVNNHRRKGLDWRQSTTGQCPRLGLLSLEMVTHVTELTTRQLRRGRRERDRLARDPGNL